MLPKRVKAFVRGYHEYNEIWEPEISQEAILKREPKTNWTAVAVVRCDASADRTQRKLERSDGTPVQHSNEYN